MQWNSYLTIVGIIHKSKTEHNTHTGSSDLHNTIYVNNINSLNNP